MLKHGHHQPIFTNVPPYSNAIQSVVTAKKGKMGIMRRNGSNRCSAWLRSVINQKVFEALISQKQD